MSTSRATPRTDYAAQWDDDCVDRQMISPGAQEALGGGRKSFWTGRGILHRHFRRDWGTVTKEQARRNEDAVHSGGETVGVYPVRGATIVVVVDAVYDAATGRRDAASLVLREEY